MARFFPRSFATFSAHAVSQFLRPRCTVSPFEQMKLVQDRVLRSDGPD
ncbi:hypothetical protein [Phaeovulum sp. NW3]|nr:hypothetical protein [Phaeovulum sp. NW3]MCL7466784.1 hypothetical protein [Phaeovulum sp. NW3]